MTTTISRSILILALVVFSSKLSAADEPSKSGTTDIQLQREKIMLAEIQSIRVTSTESGFPESFEEKPIFRYTDPARSYVAAAVWKLGATGRPRAIITTELHRQFRGQPIISYEFLSLTESEFTAAGNAETWSPSSSSLEFKPVPNAPTPDAAPRRRFLQMKEIVNRFSGEETNIGEEYRFRLLPQPIDRYKPTDAEAADGGIFIAAYGTNPEVLLFVESDGATWRYAAGRLSGADKISLSIDGELAWTGPPCRFEFDADATYTSSRSGIEIPGIAPDGSEIKTTSKPGRDE